MPFQSDKQRKLMYAVANNPAVAKKTGISKAVADKFIAHKAQGGAMATKMPKEGSAAYKAQERKHVNAMKKAGVDPKIVAEEKREAGLKKGGGVKKYAIGGAPMGGMPVGNSLAQNRAQQQFQAGPQTQSNFGMQAGPQTQARLGQQMQQYSSQPPNSMQPTPAEMARMQQTNRDFQAQQAAQLQNQPRSFGAAPQQQAALHQQMLSASMPQNNPRGMTQAQLQQAKAQEAAIMAQQQQMRQSPQYAQVQQMRQAVDNSPEMRALQQYSNQFSNRQPTPAEMARIQQLQQSVQNLPQVAQMQNLGAQLNAQYQGNPGQARSFGAAPQMTAPGRVPAPAPRGRGVMMNRAEGGPTKKYAFGGMTGPGGEMSPDDMAQFAESLKKEADTRRAKQGGAGMGGSPTVGFKKGGRIDGCAVKGKTKGRFI